MLQSCKQTNNYAYFFKVGEYMRIMVMLKRKLLVGIYKNLNGLTHLRLAFKYECGTHNNII